MADAANQATGTKRPFALGLQLFTEEIQQAPNQQTGRSVRVNRQRRRQRRNAGDSVGRYFGDAWSLAKRTAVGLNEIRKLINVEEKELVTSVSSTGFGTSGVISPISRVAQGTDYDERIGNSIKMQHIEVRGRIFKNTSATTSVMRVLLVRDLDGYGTIPTVANILEDITIGSPPLTQHNFLNRKRFSYLFDELLTLNNTGDSSAVFEIYMPHEGHIQYLGSTAAAASDGKGSLYMLFISDEATNTPTFSFSSRIVFTDD